MPESAGSNHRDPIPCTVLLLYQGGACLSVLRGRVVFSYCFISNFKVFLVFGCPSLSGILIHQLYSTLFRWGELGMWEFSLLAGQRYQTSSSQDSK